MIRLDTVRGNSSLRVSFNHIAEPRKHLSFQYTGLGFDGLVAAVYCVHEGTVLLNASIPDKNVVLLCRLTLTYLSDLKSRQLIKATLLEWKQRQLRTPLDQPSDVTSFVIQ